MGNSTALAKAPKRPLFRYPVGKASSRQPPTGEAGSPRGQPQPTPRPPHIESEQSNRALRGDRAEGREPVRERVTRRQPEGTFDSFTPPLVHARTGHGPLEGLGERSSVSADRQLVPRRCCVYRRRQARQARRGSHGHPAASCDVRLGAGDGPRGTLVSSWRGAIVIESSAVSGGASAAAARPAA